MKRFLIVTALVGAAASLSLSPSPASAQQLDGKALFMKNCAACHQATGKGIPGAFPALAGNAFVQGPASDPAGVLLKGRGGMPDFSDTLDDRDIATVLSFVRNNWGNKAAPLTEADVVKLRAELGVEPFSNGVVSNKH